MLPEQIRFRSVLRLLGIQASIAIFLSILLSIISLVENRQTEPDTSTVLKVVLIFVALIGFAAHRCIANLNKRLEVQERLSGVFEKRNSEDGTEE